MTHFHANGAFPNLRVRHLRLWTGLGAWSVWNEQLASTKKGLESSLMHRPCGWQPALYNLIRLDPDWRSLGNDSVSRLPVTPKFVVGHLDSASTSGSRYFSRTRVLAAPRVANKNLYRELEDEATCKDKSFFPRVTVYPYVDGHLTRSHQL